MGGDNQLTIKDWVEHLHWLIDNIEVAKNHNEKFRIPTITFLIVSLSTLVTSIFIFHWIYVVLSTLSALFSSYMIYYINRENGYLSILSNDMAKILNHLLIHDDIDINTIRIEYIKVCSKHSPIGKITQKRLRELEMKKAK